MKLMTGSTSTTCSLITSQRMRDKRSFLVFSREVVFFLSSFSQTVSSHSLNPSFSNGWMETKEMRFWEDGSFVFSMAREDQAIHSFHFSCFSSISVMSFLRREVSFLILLSLHPFAHQRTIISFRSIAVQFVSLYLQARLVWLSLLFHWLAQFFVSYFLSFLLLLNMYSSVLLFSFFDTLRVWLVRLNVKTTTDCISSFLPFDLFITQCWTVLWMIILGNKTGLKWC